MRKSKIICVHHLDDFSGSPRVLANIMEGLIAQGWEVTLLTNRQSEGFLKQLKVPQLLFDYSFKSDKIKRLQALFMAELAMFRHVWHFRNEKTVVYINTLLPFGAALSAWATGQKVVYHFHEATVPFAPLRWLAKSTARLTATKGIFVSEYLQKNTALLSQKDTIVAYNGLGDDFWEKATLAFAERKSKEYYKNILMLCSLKDYKGIPEFVALAQKMPSYNFELVVNAEKNEIENYFSNYPKIDNLQVFSKQSEVDSFYRRADVVLNLSRPDGWIESFGMTLVEALAYGIPVIGPTIGGPTEIIDDGKNGFVINGTDLIKLMKSIQQITYDPKIYQSFVVQARASAMKFQSKHTQQVIYDALISVTNN
jgi:L-malate glycosyltransferase